MIKSSLETSTSKLVRINQTNLKRKARNLRIKVKGLLPVQSCYKYLYRNRCVHELDENSHSFIEHSKKKWAMGRAKDNSYFCESLSGPEYQVKFDKLTPAEIEQINEDRLYYIGENSIQQFEKFLQKKESKNRLTKSVQEQNRNGSHYLIPKPKNNDTYHSSCISQSLTQQTDFSLTVQPWNEKHKIQMLQNKARLIENEEKQRLNNIIQKQKLSMRMQKVQTKLEEIKAKKILESEQKKMQMENTLLRISHAKKNRQNNGEIKGLTQKLRQVFLSKTTIKISKTARIQNYIQSLHSLN